MTENRRRAALAESYFELGETGKAEALYRDCLQAIRAGDGAGSGGRMATDSRARRCQDWHRAEQILREGLAVDGVRDRSI